MLWTHPRSVSGRVEAFSMSRASSSPPSPAALFAHTSILRDQKHKNARRAAVASCSRRLTTSKCVGGGGRLVAILQQHLVLSLEVGGRPHACPGRAVRPFRSRRPQQHAGGRRGQYALPQPERATEYSLRARALQAEYSLRCRRPIEDRGRQDRGRVADGGRVQPPESRAARRLGPAARR